jgi:lambda family phage portal protein
MAVARRSPILDLHGRPMVRMASAAYDGGAQGQRFRSLHAPNIGVNSTLLGTLDTMRARVRALYRSNPLIRRTVNALVANVFGCGFTPQPELEDAALHQAMRTLWRDFCRRSDAEGRGDFHSQMVLAGRMWAIAGEGLLRFRPRLASDRLPIPLQLQLLAPDHLPTWMTQTAPNGNEIVAGVEFDGIGRRVAYWLHPRHPGEGSTGPGGAGLSPVRVPAEQILHFGEPIDAGQVRYEPPLAAAILKAHRLDLHDEAQLERQLVASLYAAFFTAPDSDTGPAGTDADAPSAEGDLDVRWMPGTVGFLPPGFKMETTNPPQLPTEYVAFQKQQRRDIAGVGRVTYEQATGDYEGVTYSSVRASQNEQHREAEQIQFTTWVPQLLTPVWERFVTEAVLARKLPISPEEFARDPLPFLRVRWIGEGWAWVDPESEVNAAAKAIDYGITSRDDEIAGRGWDPEEIDRARAKGLERERRLGLPPAAGPGAEAAAPAVRPAAERTAQGARRG